ncbi:hypothetical protein CC78DRAFT_41554 [Lojkania enalia]|uniref:Uncharacterized protein n=1 Tax=Lojkania enalia TaxID=147567 RepID=A0A9P4MZY5_9PLEO|nr:hypothetical protein CC78DRAFT_41554 [Didymosphaeria enalia]
MFCRPAKRPWRDKCGLSCVCFGCVANCWTCVALESGLLSVGYLMSAAIHCTVFSVRVEMNRAVCNRQAPRDGHKLGRSKSPTLWSLLPSLRVRRCCKAASISIL